MYILHAQNCKVTTATELVNIHVWLQPIDALDCATYCQPYTMHICTCSLMQYLYQISLFYEHIFLQSLLCFALPGNSNSLSTVIPTLRLLFCHSLSCSGDVSGSFDKLPHLSVGLSFYLQLYEHM